MNIIETKKNFLDIPNTHSLAISIPVNISSAPKGSLAWQISVLYGPFNELRNSPIGTCATKEIQNGFLYLLLTRESYEGWNLMESSIDALICMREHMKNHNIKKVALAPFELHNRETKRDFKETLRTIFSNEKTIEILLCPQAEKIMAATPKCEIVEITGNLFSAPKDYSLVHSVPADFTLHNGTSLQFKCKFGRVSELKSQHKHSGSVAVIEDNNRFIYNLVTKERNHEKASYASLYYSLLSMREHMLENRVTKLAIPHLGCGIDRMNWERVKHILRMVFEDDPIEILAYFRVAANQRHTPVKSRSLADLLLKN